MAHRLAKLPQWETHLKLKIGVTLIFLVGVGFHIAGWDSMILMMPGNMIWLWEK